MKAHFKYYIAIFITLTVGLFNFNKASATEKVDALLQQFDQAQPNRQRAIAKNLFRQLEKEEFLDEPFSIPAHWPADSIRAEVWSTAGQYYFTTRTSNAAYTIPIWRCKYCREATTLREWPTA